MYAMTAKRLVLLVLVVATCGAAALGRGSVADNGPCSVSIVYLVRHAERPPGSNPDLCAEGKDRAKTLAWMLNGIRFASVHHTKWTRTKSTVEAVARDSGIEPRVYEGGDEKKLLDSILATTSSAPSLVCGHSNTVPTMLKHLGVPIKESVLSAYDDLFIVILVGDANGKVLSSKLQRLK